MFPGAHARIYRNEAGEPIGWDYPPDDDDMYDPHEDYDRPPTEADFKRWLRDVDAYLTRICGLTHRDLPDGPWRDYFNDELDSDEAVWTYAEDDLDEMGLLGLLEADLQ